jgi:hypothetical protein
MNLITWILVGGLLGGMTAYFFSSTVFVAAGDVIWSFIGALYGGLLAAVYLPYTPIADFDARSFSPGGFVWAAVLALIMLIAFNYSVR